MKTKLVARSNRFVARLARTLGGMAMTASLLGAGCAVEGVGEAPASSGATSRDTIAADGFAVTPAYEHDEWVGLELSAVQPGSVPAALGLENGDLLRELDGSLMLEARELLEACAVARSGDTIHVLVTRGGADLLVVHHFDEPRLCMTGS